MAVRRRRRSCGSLATVRPDDPSRGRSASTLVGGAASPDHQARPARTSAPVTRSPRRRRSMYIGLLLIVAACADSRATDPAREVAAPTSSSMQTTTVTATTSTVAARQRRSLPLRFHLRRPHPTGGRYSRGRPRRRTSPTSWRRPIEACVESMPRPVNLPNTGDASNWPSAR